MSLVTEQYDTADYLHDREDIVAYLEEAVESNDARILAKSLRTVARALANQDELAKSSGLSPQEIQEALSGEPTTVIQSRMLETYGVSLKSAA